jgi:hypothetical protein
LRTRLDSGEMVLDRVFFVEILRGGMNRLLLRSLPTSEELDRVEVLFQYVQGLLLPSFEFDGLTISCVDSEPPFEGLQVKFPECLTFELTSGRTRGVVVAAACVVERGVCEPDAPSFFPMM